MTNIPQILCIETSGETCSVCISYGNKMLALLEETKVYSHAKVITQLIDRCLRVAGKSISEINAISLSAGPGSYTSLRVGSSAAKGMCFALSIPLITIPSLQIIADSTDYPSEYIASTINARRENLYWGIYKRDQEIIATTFSSAIEFKTSIKNWIEKDIRFTGNGWLAINQINLGDLQLAESKLNAKAMIVQSINKYNRKKWADLASYAPLYIRPPHITTPKKISLF